MGFVSAICRQKWVHLCAGARAVDRATNAQYGLPIGFGGLPIGSGAGAESDGRGNEVASAILTPVGSEPQGLPSGLPIGFG
jgi:hypothetical protein